LFGWLINCLFGWSIDCVIDCWIISLFPPNNSTLPLKLLITQRVVVSVQYSTVQYSVQYSAITVQYSSAEYSFPIILERDLIRTARILPRKPREHFPLTFVRIYWGNVRELAQGHFRLRKDLREKYKHISQGVPFAQNSENEKHGKHDGYMHAHTCTHLKWFWNRW